MSAALATAAAGALRRLKREQDAAAARAIDLRIADPGASPAILAASATLDAAALATSRGEAYRAVGALFDALPGGDPVPVLLAHTQRDTLHGSAPIPSATLTAWADGWDAYAATIGCAS